MGTNENPELMQWENRLDDETAISLTYDFNLLYTEYINSLPPGYIMNAYYDQTELLRVFLRIHQRAKYYLEFHGMDRGMNEAKNAAYFIYWTLKYRPLRVEFTPLNPKASTDEKKHIKKLLSTSQNAFAYFSWMA